MFPNKVTTWDYSSSVLTAELSEARGVFIGASFCEREGARERGPRESVVKHNCLLDGWNVGGRERDCFVWWVGGTWVWGLVRRREGDKRGRLSQTNMFLLREKEFG